MSSDPYQLLASAEAAASYRGDFYGLWMLNIKGWFGQNKHDEAQDLFQLAANQFKLAKKFSEAANCFQKLAEFNLRLGEKDEAATAFLNASKAFKKSHPKESVQCLESAVGLLAEKGRFQSAANNQKSIAEVYESELEDFEKAYLAYELAAEWYHGEDSNSQANACQIKAATIAAQLEKYDVAIQKFETVAKASIDNNLTKWSVREYLLKAGICVLCTHDFVRAKRSFDQYTLLDMTFTGTREYKLLVDLLEACEGGDPELFTNVLFDFDKLTKLDNWKTMLLLRVKKTLESEEESLR